MHEFVKNHSIDRLFISQYQYRRLLLNSIDTNRVGEGCNLKFIIDGGEIVISEIEHKMNIKNYWVAV